MDVASLTSMASPSVLSSPQDYTAALPRKRMAAGVMFTDESERVLLVEPIYKEYWGGPRWVC
jgi:hypothetical protein